jgi:hypothetical protein
MDLFWNALETKLPDMLLKGNPIAPTSELYELLNKKKNGNLSESEQEKLIKLLEHEITTKEHTPGEEVAMLLMTLAMKQKAVS